MRFGAGIGVYDPTEIGVTADKIADDGDTFHAALRLVASSLAGELVPNAKAALAVIVGVNDGDENWAARIPTAFTMAEQFVEGQIRSIERALGIEHPMTAIEYVSLRPSERAKLNLGRDEVQAIFTRSAKPYRVGA